MYAGMVIKIPQIKTKNISLLGSLNLSDTAKIITIKTGGKIVIESKNKSIFFHLPSSLFGSAWSGTKIQDKKETYYWNKSNK